MCLAYTPSPVTHNLRCSTLSRLAHQSRRAVRVLLVISLVALLVGCDAPADSEVAARPPNIILIVADDLGYGDLGSYGQEQILTPRLDQMAAEGTRFTQFYAGSTVCAPSRYVLMTGYHTGHAYARGNVGWPRGDVPLQPEDATLAETLAPAGYTSGVFGKWALGLENTTGAPHRRGFDAFLGYIDQSEAHQYYVTQLQTIQGDTTVNLAVDSTDYSHDLIVDATLDFIRANADQPFFVYAPYTIPHAELLVPEESMAPYRNADGSSIFPETPFAGRGRYRPQAQPNAALAGMISRLDRDVGRILDLLDELGLANDTVVLFTSDNGPHEEGGTDPEFFDRNGPLRGHKRDLYEGGIRVPMIAWGAQIPAGRVSDQPWAMWDFMPTFADLADVSAPAGLDGISMVPALTGTALQPPHDYLYWEFLQGGTFKQALRQGDWKALRFIEADDEPVVELYNLGDDPGETTDLADEHPEIVDRLTALMDEARTEPALPEFRIPTD